MGEVFFIVKDLERVCLFCKKISAARESEGANSPIDSRREAISVRIDRLVTGYF